MDLFFCFPGECQAQHSQCHIQKCTTHFVSLTSHLNPSLYGFETEFCQALRTLLRLYPNTPPRAAVVTWCSTRLCWASATSWSSVTAPGTGQLPPLNSKAPTEPCDYHGHQLGSGAGENPHLHYLFCGLFGDPHLRTFKDDFQTCKVEGAWPLIDNNYLSVQVTNVPLVPDSHATATIKVSHSQSVFLSCVLWTLAYWFWRSLF